MLNPFFPQPVDNAYRGSRLALWLFALVVLLKLGVSLDAVFNGEVMASRGDAIPLGTFTAAGAQTVISLFALWGLAQLMICLLGVLVLARYRTLIPFMFALLLLEHLARKLVLHFLPMARAGAAGESPGISPFPYGFALLLIGLALSLWKRPEGGRDRPRPSP
jgi:hypothetical protein